MKKKDERLARLDIPNLQNYYRWEMGAIPGQQEIEEIVHRLTTNRMNNEKRE